MATVQSTLYFQDKMSAAINSVANNLEMASIKAEMAKRDLDELENQQSEWKKTLDAATSSTVRNEQEMNQIIDKYNAASKAVDKARLAYLQQENAVIKNETQLQKLKNQQEEYNKKLDQTRNKVNQNVKGFESMQGKLVTLASAMQIFNQIVSTIQSVNNKINEYVRYTEAQMQAEDKLAIITKARMNLDDAQVRSLYNLAAAQQRVGVIGDEVSIAGMSTIASFVKQKASIEALTPAMDNLIAKNKGYHASVQDAQAVSRGIAMAMQGNTGMMRRLGVAISDTQKKWLMTLPEEQRAVELAKMITATTGNLNEEMAKTPLGQVAQANNRLSDSYEKLGAALLPIQAMFMEFWSNFVEKVVNNLDTIVPLVLGALTAVSGAFIALKGEAIAAAVSTAAEWAVAFWPLTLGIGIIAALSAAFNAMGVDFQTQAQNLVISGLWIINSFKNIGIAIQNTWQAGKLSVKLFIDGSQLLFANFFSWVLNKLAILARGIDAVFKTNLSGAIGNLSAASDKVQNDIKGRMRTNTTQFMTQYKPFEENSFWANQAKAQSMMSGLKGGMLTDRKLAGTAGVGGIDPELLTSAGGGKALKTKNQGSISIKDEDIKMLHDLATRDYMVNYQSLTPQVTIPNMVLHENVDVNAVVDTIVSGIAEVSGSSLKAGERAYA